MKLADLHAFLPPPRFGQRDPDPFISILRREGEAVLRQMHIVF